MKASSKKTLLMLAVFVFSLTVLFTACNDKSDINSPQDDSYSSPMYAVIDQTDFEFSVEDATLENDMVMSETMLGYSFLNMGSGFSERHPLLKRALWLSRFDFNKHLGRLLHSLKLSDDQKKSVAGLMKEYHAGMKELVKKFYEANKDIIKNANIERKAIADALKGGSITREEAIAKLKKLNEETRSKIAANPANSSIKNDVCLAKTALLKNIATVLSPDQLVKWNLAVSKVKFSC